MQDTATKKDEKLTVAPVDKMTQELAKENITDKLIAQFKEEYMGLTITGVDDKEGYKRVHEARMTCKNTRVLTTKVCKKGREEAIAVQKAWIEKEKEVVGKITEIESHLQAEQQRIDDEKERIKREAEEAAQAKIQERASTLAGLGCQFNGTQYTIGEINPISMEQIKVMPDEHWNALIQEVTAESDRLDKVRAEEEARLQAEKEEQERKQREQEEELKRLRAEKEEREERERLQQGRLEMMLEYKSYIDTDLSALWKLPEEEFQALYHAIKGKYEAEKQKREEAAKAIYRSRVQQLSSMGFQPDLFSDDYIYGNDLITVPDDIITNGEPETWDEMIATITPQVMEYEAEAERKRQEAIEEGKRIAAEQERQRLEAERKAEEERKAAEEAERKREESLRPDKDKLLTLGNTIVQLPLPDVQSEEAQAILKDVQELLNKAQMFIVKKVKSL